MNEAEQARLHATGLLAIGSAGAIITDLFRELGESPEAVRGAACVAEMCRQIMATVINVDVEVSDRDIDAEMATAGVVMAMLMRTIHDRVKRMEQGL